MQTDNKVALLHRTKVKKGVLPKNERNYKPQFAKNETTNCINTINRMNKFRQIALGILGATILSAGLYSCSNDDETTNASTEQTITGKRI